MVRAHPTVPPLRIAPLSQHLIDRPAGFVPPQKPAQMALRRVALNLAANGQFLLAEASPLGRPGGSPMARWT